MVEINISWRYIYLHTHTYIYAVYRNRSKLFKGAMNDVSSPLDVVVLELWTHTKTNRLPAQPSAQQVLNQHLANSHQCFQNFKITMQATTLAGHVIASISIISSLLCVAD